MLEMREWKKFIKIQVHKISFLRIYADLMLIFVKTPRSGCLPALWKWSVGVPLFKSGSTQVFSKQLSPYESHFC